MGQRYNGYIKLYNIFEDIGKVWSLKFYFVFSDLNIFHMFSRVKIGIVTEFSSLWWQNKIKYIVRRIKYFNSGLLIELFLFCICSIREVSFYDCLISYNIH